MAAKNDIYTTETEYTFPEFRKMCIAQTLNDRKMMLVMIGIEALFAVIAAVFVMIRARAFLLIALPWLLACGIVQIRRLTGAEVHQHLHQSRVPKHRHHAQCPEPDYLPGGSSGIRQQHRTFEACLRGY